MKRVILSLSLSILFLATGISHAVSAADNHSNLPRPRVLEFPVLSQEGGSTTIVGLGRDGTGNLLFAGVNPSTIGVIQDTGSAFNLISSFGIADSPFSVTTDGAFYYVTIPAVPFTSGIPRVAVYSMSGVLQSSFSIADEAPNAAGITYASNSGSLFTIDPFGGATAAPERILEYSTSGTFLGSMDLSALDVRGLSFDEDRCSFWIYSREADVIYQLDEESGAVLATADGPGHFDGGDGADLTILGDTLYVAAPDVNSIFVYDVSSAPQAPGCEPCESQGRGTLSFESATENTVEGERKIFRVDRLNGCEGSVSVQASTVEGTAEADLDFELKSEILSWGHGESTGKEFVVQILDDIEFEADETFEVRLASPTGGSSIAPFASSLVVLEENDLASSSGLSETPISSSGGAARISASPDGGNAVVWSAPETNGDGLGIFLQYFDSAGISMGPSIHLNTTTHGDQDHPDSAYDASGRLLVVWDSASPGQGTSIRGQLMNVDHSPAGGEIAVDTGSPSETVSGPSVSGDAAGEFRIAWGVRSVDSNASVTTRTFTANSMSLGSISDLESQGNGERPTAPRVATNSAGDTLIMWRTETIAEGPRSAKVQCKLLDGEGGDSGVVTIGAAPADGKRTSPVAAMNEDGIGLAAWSSAEFSGESGDLDIVGQFVSLSGVPVPGHFRINKETIGNQHSPRVSVSPDGSFFVIWTSDAGSAAAAHEASQELRIYAEEACTPSTPGASTVNGGGVTAQLPGAPPEEECLGDTGDDSDTDVDTGPNGNTSVTKPRGGGGNNGGNQVAETPSRSGIAAFSLPEVSAGEGSSVTLFVERKGGSIGAVSVFYSTVLHGGSASPGSDFVTTNGTLNWADGDIAPKSFAVQIPADQAIEGPEDFYVRLDGGSTTGGLIVRGPARQRVNIVDDPPVGGCDGLCLNDERFIVTANWRKSTGEMGEGTGESLTNDTGYFWFFRESNIEVVIKVLDACGLNNRYWVFAGGLTDVQVDLTVTDTLTGQSVSYHNNLGEKFQPIQDTNALASCSTNVVAGPAALASQATPTGKTLPLNGERFLVQADWETADASGTGDAVLLTEDSGYFWFFNSDNVELIVKVLDACAVNNHYWVFAGGLTDVGVNLRVTDSESGEVRVYQNVRGNAFQPIQDTTAFMTCP